MRLRAGIPLSLALTALWLASIGAAPVEDLEAVEAGGCDETFESAGRLGGFYTNFWPNGVVPYEFVTGSTDSIPTRNGSSWTRVLSDVTFSIDNDGTFRISSPTGFPSTWALFDIVRCEGSTNNDGLDMTLLAGNLSSLTVEIPDGQTFTPESPSPSVKFFVTRSVSDQNQARFEDAAARWEAVADVNLRPRQSGDTDYIRVSNFNRNYVAGDVGHGSGARTLTMNAWNSRRTITHEIGHSLGAKHEHQRPDRNTYVAVDTSILSPNVSLGDFDVDNSMAVYPTEFYDYGSIMHYTQNAGLASGQTGPVITILDPDDAAVWQTAMGNVDSLSHWDKRTMSFMYPESNWRFLDGGTVATWNDGNFITPYKDFDFALADMPTGGRLFITHPRNYVQPGTYSKAMTISAPQGGVTIRAN
jgi:hypothetical protein